VKPAIRGVLVFPRAIPAHLEGCHGGKRSVIGDILDDREAGAAVRAIDEGITMTPVKRVKKLT
jgi:hypothetical protein